MFSPTHFMAKKGCEDLDESKLLTRITRDLRVKLILLDNFYSEIDTLQGIAVSGSIAESASNPYRRTGNFSLVITTPGDLLPEPKSKLWFGNRIKVLVGLNNIYNGTDIEWYNLGIFSVLNVNFNLSGEERTANFSVGDNMAYLNGDLGGRMAVETTVLPRKSNITEAIVAATRNEEVINIMPDMIDVKGYPAKVPIEITQSPGSTAYDLIKSLVDLYMGYEFFFDRDGILKIQKVRDSSKDRLIWDFTKEKDLKISISSSLDYTNVKNSITVWGRILDNGKQIYWRYRNRFLRDTLKVYNHMDYDEYIFPYIYDQEIGDICHVENLRKTEEIFVDDDNEQLCPHLSTDRFYKMMAGKEKSFVWTKHYTKTETFTTDADGQVRLTSYPADEYDIIIKSTNHPDDELSWRKDMTKVCIGEDNTRFITIIKTNPEPIEGEILRRLEDADGSVYVFKNIIYDVDNVIIYVNDKQISGAKITNRNEKGIVYFDFIPKEEDKVVAYYSTYTPRGEVYINEEVFITYTYEIIKPMWVELDFLVVPKFNMENLGEKIQAIEEENIYSIDQAQLNAEYALWNSSNFNENISISSVPIYSLETNRKIRVNEEKAGVKGDYLITDLNFPLDIENPMSITAAKIYNPLVNHKLPRNNLPGMLPLCKTTSMTYPSTITKGYIYNFKDVKYELVELADVEIKLYLTSAEIDQLIDFANLIPFATEADKNVFIAKAKIVYSSVVFPTELDKNAFIITMTQNNKTVMDVIREAPNNEYTVDENVKLIHRYCHYVSGNSGQIWARYDLGRGNTFEYFSLQEKEEPPADYMNRYTNATDCSYIENNWPMPEYDLPYRPFKLDPKIHTNNPPTQHFVRRSGKLGMDYIYYPYEPYIQTKIISHFCANIKDSSWDAQRYGDMPVPTDESPLPIVHEEVVHFGAVSGSFPIKYVLSMGNMAEKLEILYKDLVIYNTEEESDSDAGFFNKPTKKDVLINWLPEEGYYDVIFKITSKRKDYSYLQEQDDIEEG